MSKNVQTLPNAKKETEEAAAKLQKTIEELQEQNEALRNQVPDVDDPGPTDPAAARAGHGRGDGSPTPSVTPASMMAAAREAAEAQAMRVTDRASAEDDDELIQEKLDRLESMIETQYTQQHEDMGLVARDGVMDDLNKVFTKLQSSQMPSPRLATDGDVRTVLGGPSATISADERRRASMLLSRHFYMFESSLYRASAWTARIASAV